MDEPQRSLKGRASSKAGMMLLLLVIAAGVGYFCWVATRNSVEVPAVPNMMSKHEIAERRPPPQALPGELLLKDYGADSVRPEADLGMLANALGNLTLLIKGTNPFPLGSNEEFAAALRGKNRIRLRFLPDVHKAFNARNQLVDRWTTPLFFHAVAHDRIDIRSAGPDRQMWTEDDLHRKYDGQFLRAKDLNPNSLFDSNRPGSAAR